MSDDGRLDLRTVSLVCVETRRHPLAIAAMQRCMAMARFAQCLLLSPTAPAVPDGIGHHPIAPINCIEDYSEFMLRRLGTCFTSEHALVVQWDGFAIDRHCWSADFLDYDYIGAPWNDAARSVGNGGFSLRSRRLCVELAKLAPSHWHPEDVRICHDLRPHLEAVGIRFAPTAVAERFAFEEPRPEFPTFGFHGLFNFHHVLSEPELLEFLHACDDRIVFSVHARRLLKRCYASGMRRAARAIHERRMTGPPAMRLDAIKLRALAASRRWAGAR